MKLKQIRVSGYKNLVDCEINLGDFNVIVGPNNSGKSNLLEVIQMIYCFCFGDEELQGAAFRGNTENPILNIGITFQTHFEKKNWTVKYDFSVERNREKDGGFLMESLKAKPSSQTGQLVSYISRKETNLKIKGKSPRKIAKKISALNAIRSIYPDYENLPSEIAHFVSGISAIAMSDIFAISPENLRDSLGKEKELNAFRTSAFNIIKFVDSISQNKKNFEIFKENLCDILDLEEVVYFSKEVEMLPDKKKEQISSTRIQNLLLKRRGDRFAPISEYSDGTLVVTSILAALLSKEFEGPLFYIEEIENCLHPSAVKKLLRFLQDQADQRPVLLTTHSPFVLNCVDPTDVNVAKVDQKGATHFEKIKNTKQLRDYLNSGFMSFGDMLASNFKDIQGD